MIEVTSSSPSAWVWGENGARLAALPCVKPEDSRGNPPSADATPHCVEIRQGMTPLAWQDRVMIDPMTATHLVLTYKP